MNEAVHDFSSKMLRLLAHVVHQIRAQDAFRKPREVLNQRGQGELASRFLTFDQQRGKIGAGAIDGCGQTGGSPIR